MTTSTYRPKNTFNAADLETIAKGLEDAIVYAPVSPETRALRQEIVDRIRRKPILPVKEPTDRVEFR